MLIRENEHTDRRSRTNFMMIVAHVQWHDFMRLKAEIQETKKLKTKTLLGNFCCKIILMIVDLELILEAAQLMSFGVKAKLIILILGIAFFFIDLLPQL